MSDNVKLWQEEKDANSAAWHTATSQEEKDRLHARNVELSEQIDKATGMHSTFDEGSGVWTTTQKTPGEAARVDMDGGAAHWSGGTSRYDQPPDYNDRYQREVDRAVDAHQSREPFRYDYESDPAYQQYREAYTREGQRAMEDTLGQVSARTGGMASSYATSAAEQANNDYMRKLADKVPQLQQLAYQMYQDQQSRDLADIQLYTGLQAQDRNWYLNSQLNPYYQDQDLRYRQERDRVADDQWRQEMDFSRRQAELAQDQWQKSFDRGVYESDRDYGYNVDRDGRADAWQEKEWDYATQSDAYDRALQRWQITGTVSAEDAAILGVPVGTPTSDERYRQAQLAARQPTARYATRYTPQSQGMGDEEFAATRQTLEYYLKHGQEEKARSFVGKLKNISEQQAREIKNLIQGLAL